MRPEIAIIGAGITGIMTALACARKGAVVDLYDAENIPNTGNLSWASGRLWKHIHEHNGSLEPLALASLPYWEALIMRSGGELGCRTESLRLLPLNDTLELERHYRARGARCYIQEPQASEQSQVFRFSTNKHLFIGCDAVLLNARKICQQLLDELTQCRNVTLRPVTPVNLMALANGRLFEGISGDRQYSAVVSATSRPLQAGLPAIRACARVHYQVHFDVHVNDSRKDLLKPVLHFGDDKRSWCVPSPDRSILKLSASQFSFPESPLPEMVEACCAYLLAQLNISYTHVQSHVSAYYEIPSEKRQTSPYWYTDPQTGVVTVDSCDASIFKIAPALSDQISQHVINGVTL